MIKQSKAIAMTVAAVMMALAPVAASAGPNNKNLGASRGGAKSSVNRGGGGGMGGGGMGGGGMGGGGAGNYNKANAGNNRPNNNRPGNKPNRGGNNVTVNNTNNVNVSGNNRAPNRNGNYNNGYNNSGYYNNGRYYNNNNNGNWDNDDNDFLEFVGKTAAITAGVSVVAAVIGSTVNEKPSGCQETVSNGQVYMNCNGTWYQPMQAGGQTQYQVIAPPR